MAIPRLGQASVLISFGDADGLRVQHGSYQGSTLLHVPPERLESSDWSRVWATLREIEATAAERAPKGKESGDADA